MTRQARYCCRRHAPPFRVRLAVELRERWRDHLAPALARGLIVGGLLLGPVIAAR